MTSPVSRLLTKGLVSVCLSFCLSAAVPALAEVQESQILTSQQDLESVVSNPSPGSQPQSLRQLALSDPQKPVRLLVKLEGEALVPYLKKERAKLGVDSRNMKASDRQQLAEKSQNHQQQLRKAQQNLLTKMRQEKLLIASHREFISLTNALVITAKAGDVARIKKMPGVVDVYLDNQVRANLSQSVPALGLSSVWQRLDDQDRPLTGTGIRVAILDTGIDYTHPDLGGCLGPNCKVVGGYNFTGEGDVDDVMDVDGHGTHVAGIVAANGEIKGVAPGASLYAYKVLNNNGFGLDSGIIEALEKVVDPDGDPLTDDQMHVANLSLGSPGVIDSPVVDAANQAMDAGVVLVVAAGNEGDRYFTVSAPGTAEKVITVGAIDRENNIADFSSRGPVSNKGFIKPEILAPGVEINSAAPGGEYIALDGTSMATPHVAGAAALLLQKFPDATPAEIKTRLLASAKDLGFDVFEQGMGLLDISAALDLTVAADMPLVALGHVDIDQATWSQDFSLSLVNLGNQTQQLKLLIGDLIPAGVTFSILSNSEMQLAAGGRAQVDVRVNVDNSVLPFADKDTLHHQANLLLSHNNASFRLPVTLFKAAQLRLKGSTGLSTVQVYGENLSRYYDVNCGEQDEVLYVPLRPGTYHTIWQFASEQDCDWPDSMVLRRNIELQSKTQVTATRDEAVYELSLDDVIDMDGVRHSLDEYTVAGYCSTFWGPFMLQQFFTCAPLSSSARLVKSNKLDPDFQFSFGLLLQKRFNEMDADNTLIYISGVLDDGLSSSKKIPVDMRNMGWLDFEYHDPTYLFTGVKLGVTLGQIYGLDGKSSFSMGSSLDEVHQVAFEARLYASLAELKKGEWFPRVEVTLNQEFWSENYVWKSALLDTGPLGFIDKGSIFKLSSLPEYPYDFVFEHNKPRISIENNGYYFSGYFVYESGARQISSFDHSFCPFCYSFMKDETHTVFGDSISYAISCEGQRISEGVIEKTLLANVGAARNCEVFTVEAEMETRFLGASDISTVEVLLPSAAIDEETGHVDSLAIQELALLDAGEVSRGLKSESPEVRLVVAPSPVDADKPRKLDVSIGLKLKNDEGWTDLPLTNTGNVYLAQLPVIGGSHLASLRVSIKDDEGRSTVQTLNSIFLLGLEGEASWRFPVLPQLTIEATGPLTDYQWPEVFVQNASGERIPATTTDAGPYGLGSHRIEWRVTTPNGAEFSTSQILNVIDTTPPAVVVESLTTVTASAGSMTVDNPVQASAQDLVDGEVSVTPDKTGPFAVGEHQILWVASDNSGNTSVQIQTLIVKAQPVAPRPTPASPSGGKKSGGSVGYEFLALLFVLLCARRRLRLKFNR